MISYADVVAAAARLSPFAAPTPMLSHPTIDEVCGARIYLKAENLQVTGAFKFRGACNVLAAMSDAERQAGVVAFSSGNHARAVATAATLHGTASTIVMPSDAPAEKIDATRAAGADVITYDRYTEDREAIARDIAGRSGAAVIPPYDHPGVIAGQGTLALELVDQAPPLDALLVCVGGGGLLAGCATVFAERSPDTAIFGVEPEAGDDHKRSRAAGERVDIGVPRTIADGQQVSSPGLLTWPTNNALVTDFLTVSDDEIVDTMRLLFEHANLVVEPSGASALAAAVHGRLPDGIDTIGVTISGGNIGWRRFRSLLDR